MPDKKERQLLLSVGTDEREKAILAYFAGKGGCKRQGAWTDRRGRVKKGGRRGRIPVLF